MKPFTFVGCIVVVACVAALPVSAQIYDSDNVVLLARRDMWAGYNDTWGFVGNDGREYVWQGTTSGSAFWDVEDPVHPVLVGYIPGGSSVWRDAFVIGDGEDVMVEISDLFLKLKDQMPPQISSKSKTRGFANIKNRETWWNIILRK